MTVYCPKKRNFRKNTLYYWTKGINQLDYEHVQPCVHQVCKVTGKRREKGRNGTLELQPHRVISMLVIWYVIPTFVFWWKESENGWTVFTAFYFSFITLSSIGFGDYTPSHIPRVPRDGHKFRESCFWD